MPKDPFKTIRFIEDMNRNREAMLSGFKSVQSSISYATAFTRPYINTVAIPKTVNVTAQYEKLLKPRELVILQRSANEIIAHSFGIPQLHASLNALLDVPSTLPQYDLAKQLQASFFDDRMNITPCFAKFSSYASTISEEELLHSEDDKIPPKIEEAINIALPSVNRKKLSADLLSFLLSLIMFACQLYSDYQTGQYLNELLEYEERQTIALETLAENSAYNTLNNNSDDLVPDNRDDASNPEYRK